MNSKPRLAALAAVAAGAWLLLSTGGANPAPKPTGPDLLPAFRQTDDSARAKADARTLAELCNAIANAIEYDGARGDQARLQTGIQLDQLRRWAREYALHGESLGTKYPQLPDKIGQFLDAEVGTAGGKIDAETRQRWIQAHRTLSACAAWTAEQL